MLVIGLTGKPRAGKDTAANYIAFKYGFIKINMSDLLARILRKRKIKPTKKALSDLGDELREKNNKHILGSLLVKEIERLKKKTRKDKFVISGFRSIEEVNAVKKKTKNFYLIRVNAPLKARFKRKTKDEKTLKEFLDRERKELYNKGMLLVLRKADFSLYNNGSKTHMFAKIDKLMKLLYINAAFT